MDEQNLSGQLADWSVNELLQIMQVTKKTGALKIEGDKRGRIHFKEGAVTGADLTGTRQTYVAKDRQAIADVLYVLATLEKGTFAVGPGEPPDGDGWSVEEILADVEGLADLESAVEDSGLIEAAGVRVAETLEEPIELDPAEWQVIASLIQPFTFAHLESRLGRGGAVRTLHTLHRLDVASPITSEDESQFLDRLAQGISGDSAEPTWLEVQGEGSADDSSKTSDDESEPAAKHAASTETEPEPEEAIPAAQPDSASESEPETEEEQTPRRIPAALRGVSADASTTLTDGVYDEIRRLRSKAAEK